MLNGDTVNLVFRSCLYTKDEVINRYPETPPVFVKGINIKVGFNPCRLETYKATINNLLDEIDLDFKKGYTFLNFCKTKEGRQWTGSHQIMQELMLLGLAIGRIEYCFESELWDKLPGGVPYIIIKDCGGVNNDGNN